jgi:hypothetical protein
MSKTKQASLMILELVRGGMEVNDAVDTVLGAGTFAKLADDLHDAFNA